MEEIIDHNQSGNPVQDEDEMHENDRIDVIDHEPNIQAAGPIENEDHPDQMQLMNQVIYYSHCIKLWFILSNW